MADWTIADEDERYATEAVWNWYHNNIGWYSRGRAIQRRLCDLTLGERRETITQFFEEVLDDYNLAATSRNRVDSQHVRWDRLVIWLQETAKHYDQGAPVTHV